MVKKEIQENSKPVTYLYHYFFCRGDVELEVNVKALSKLLLMVVVMSLQALSEGCS